MLDEHYYTNVLCSEKQGKKSWKWEPSGVFRAKDKFNALSSTWPHILVLLFGMNASDGMEVCC